MQIINATTEYVVMSDSSGHNEVFAPLIPIRYNVRRELVDIIDGIPLYKDVFSNFRNMPSPMPSTLYIVEEEVAQHFKRDDFIFYSDIVKNDAGEVIAAKSFIKY